MNAFITFMKKSDNFTEKNLPDLFEQIANNLVAVEIVTVQPKPEPEQVVETVAHKKPENNHENTQTANTDESKMEVITITTDCMIYLNLN